MSEAVYDLRKIPPDKILNTIRNFFGQVIAFVEGLKETGEELGQNRYFFVFRTSQKFECVLMTREGMSAIRQHIVDLPNDSPTLAHPYAVSEMIALAEAEEALTPDLENERDLAQAWLKAVKRVANREHQVDDQSLSVEFEGLELKQTRLRPVPRDINLLHLPQLH